MAIQRKMALTNTNACWSVVAPNGNRVAQVYSGMRVGEDSTTGLSLKPEDALVELGIERNLLSVQVLARPGESEVPPIWVHPQARVRINLPNTVFLIDPEGVAGDASAHTIEIQVRPTPTNRKTPTKTIAVSSFGNLRANLRTLRTWFSGHVPAVLVTAGILSVILLGLLVREVTPGAAEGEAPQNANVSTTDIGDANVVQPGSDPNPELQEVAVPDAKPDTAALTSADELDNVDVGAEPVAASTPATASGASNVSPDDLFVEDETILSAVEPTQHRARMDDADADRLQNEPAQPIDSVQTEQIETNQPGEVGLFESREVVSDEDEFLFEDFDPAPGVIQEAGTGGLRDELAGQLQGQLPPSIAPALSFLPELAAVAVPEIEPTLAVKPGSPSLYPFANLKVVRQRAPVYPRAAPIGASGVVDVEFTVTETGKVDKLQIRGDPPEYFARAAVKALRGWRFEAIVVDGKRVSVRSILRISFREKPAVAR